MQNLISKIFEIGCYDDLSVVKQNRVRDVNVHAFTSIVLILPQPFVLFAIFPKEPYWFVILIVLLAEFSAFYYNYRRMYKLASLLATLIASLGVFYFSLVFGFKANIQYIQLAIFLTIIFNYTKDEGKFYVYYSTVPILFILLIAFTPLGYIFALKITERNYEILNYLVIINSIFTILVYSYLFVKRNNKNIENLSFLKDKTAHENTELRKQNTELDKFVYYTSHDLKSPLSSLNGLISLAQREHDVKKIHEYLFLQEKVVNKLTNFVNDLIDATKNKLGELSISEIDVEADLKSLFENICYSNGKSDIDFSIAIDQKFKLISDRNSFYLIANNLMSNAMRYQKDFETNKKIKISGVVNATSARLLFYDNGIGIAPENLPHIFEMFYRAAHSKDGTGLGLFIVQEALNKLGGQITVNSVKNSHTVFEVIIPNSISAKTDLV